MSRPAPSTEPARPPARSFAAAAAGAVVALVVAAVINAVLGLVAGDTLVVPGELGVGQIVTYTLVMAIPAALLLHLLPRWFAWIVIVVAVATWPFPFAEFGTPIAYWLSGMHLVAGVSAALIAPRVAAAIAQRSTTTHAAA